MTLSQLFYKVTSGQAYHIWVENMNESCLVGPGCSRIIEALFDRHGSNGSEERRLQVLLISIVADHTIGAPEVLGRWVNKVNEEVEDVEIANMLK